MSTIRDQIKQAIFGQESSYGKADTSQENYAGARGPMQVTRSTFDGMKSKGLIPKEFDHANPEHTKQAGNTLIDTLADKYGDDPRKVAAAYYSGEKSVRPDGTIANYRDKVGEAKGLRPPTTHQYADQVLARMAKTSGMPVPQASAPVAEPKGAVKVTDAWIRGAPAPSQNDPEGGKPITGESFPALPTIEAPLPDSGAEQARAVAASAAAVKAGQKYDSTGLIDIARASFLDTFAGSAIKAITAPTFEPLPGYDPRAAAKEKFDGMSDDEQNHLSEAQSPAELERTLFEIQDRRDRMAVSGSKGMGWALAGGFVAGAPEGFMTGLAAMRTFQMLKVGSGQLAAKGSVGAARASLVAENAGVNLGLAGVQDQYDNYVGASDYLMGAGFGVFGAATQFKAIGRVADAAAAERAGMKMMDDAARDQLPLREEAFKNLGPDATTSQVVAEMTRLDAERIKAQVTSLTSVSSDRRLLPEELDESIEAAASSRTVGADEPQGPTKRFASEKLDAFTESGSLTVRDNLARTDPQWITNVRAGAEGRTMEELDRLPSGLNVLPDAAKDQQLAPAIRVAKELSDSFLAGRQFVVGKIGPIQQMILATEARKQTGKDVEVSGVAVSTASRHIIGLKSEAPGDNVKVVVHEIGHAIGHDLLKDAPPGLRARMQTEFDEFTKEFRAGKATARFKRFSEGSDSIIDGNLKTRGKLPDDRYTASSDEYLAEAFVRYIQKRTRDAGEGGLVDKEAIGLLEGMWNKIKELWADALGKGYLPKDTAYFDFFDNVLRGTLKQADLPGNSKTEFLDEGLTFPDFNIAIVNNPIAAKYGLQNMPQATKQEKSDYKAVLHLYRKADDPTAIWNNLDEKRLKSITDNNVFNVSSTSLLMLKSNNPVVRMLATELVESPSGAGGRRTTAAIAKYQHERRFMGNVLNEVQNEYGVWRNAQGGNIAGDIWDGKLWQKFNREVAIEIEGRRPGNTQVETSPQVKAAADSLERSYERMRIGQQAAKTSGWGALPESSIGYMPHRLSPEKVMGLTPAKENALVDSFAKQFEDIEDFDAAFSKTLAERYVDRAKARALGEHETSGNMRQIGAADMVEDALTAMGMTRPEVLAARAKFERGAAGHTKKRLKLDLNAEHFESDGTTFRMIDLFETDQFKLVRGQAGRVSGDVALASHGVMGKPGLKLLRRAMQFGESGGKAQSKEVEAFDQVAAELLGEPFGDAGGVWLNRAMTFNSVARLGGMGFTQLAESINGIFHVGVGRTLASVAGMARLRNEAKALSRGEKVDDSILTSLEDFGGAEFGTDGYKLVFPFDNGNMAYQGYGTDSVTFADRALRGASHLQAKLSMWRSIHSAQQRGMAEQIVRKSAKYLQSGGDDLALREMGISDDLLDRLRRDLPNIAKYDGGKLIEFDISKATDKKAAMEYVQAVHRGVSQIIQGTFIGETGKWAHSGLLKLMTQFRTFSITSIEKQWGRQAGTRGAATATMMLLGSMSIAAPIYIARVALAAQGRPDKDEYLEKQLSTAQITRATLNYVALSGLSGDLLDALTAITGAGEATGGRSGASSRFVGNVIAPAAGLVDDVWKGIQNTKDGTDPHELLKALPLSKLPYLVPIINSLAE